MEITRYSIDRFMSSFRSWEVQDEYAEILLNYFVHGYPPGGFFTHVLANDFVGAMCRSHPANHAHDLKNLSRWLENSGLRGRAWGDPDTVMRWLDMDPALRRALLEHAGLILTEQEEIVMALHGQTSTQAASY